MRDPLVVEDPREAAEAVEEFGSEEVILFEKVVGDAVHGRAPAIRAYLRGWRSLELRLLSLVREWKPDAVVERKGDFLFATATGSLSSYRAEILDLAAVHAPFSPWVLHFGVGKGVALFLLSEVRRSTPDLYPLVPEEVSGFPSWDISQREFNRFARLVYLAITEEHPPLHRVAEVFDLSDTALGGLFAVTRQAASQWLDGDVPASRQPRIHTIASIAALLQRNLDPHTIPGVIRKPADAYEGRSILEMIQEEREEEVLTQLQRAFDWAATA